MPAEPDGTRKGRLSPLFTWRSAIASRGGPADCALTVTREGVKTETIVKGATQRHVALTLSLHMNERGGSCYPGIERLVYESALGERAVQRALKALAATGWIHVAIADSPEGTNRYTATVPEGFVDSDFEGAYPVRGAYSEPKRGVPGTPKDVTEGVNVSATQRLRAETIELAEVWKANAPPLIDHRPAYFETAETRSSVKRARKVYPVDVIAEAIRLHATVLGSDEYRWDFRWGFREFLRRGLDRFVPEADPLGNFRQRDGRAPRHDFDDIASIG